jgi:mxaJ protein
MMRRQGLLMLCALVVCTAAGVAPPSAAPRRELRVCADPNNLPFSSERREGLENLVMARIARDLGADLTYFWWPQRRGFVRHTLNAGLCDVVPGVPAQYDPVLTTRPYYRSSYVAVSRRADGLHVTTFDDPALSRLRIGVQLIGDNGVNTPPAHALARRHIINNVRGFPVYGDYRRASPAAGIVEAVARGDIDVAFVWGPLAGYFAPRQSLPLDVRMLSVRDDPPGLSLDFDIAMGVRKGNAALRDELDEALLRLRPQIGRILDDFAVPRVEPSTAGR